MVCQTPTPPPLRISLSCLLGRCLMQGLRCHFISMSGKSPSKLEVTCRHDHSCLLGRKASNQTNKNRFRSFCTIHVCKRKLGIFLYCPIMIRNSDRGNGSHNVSLPMILKIIKVSQMLRSSCISLLLVLIL